MTEEDIQNYNREKGFGDAVKGGAQGAAVGTMVNPGVGTAVGGTLGALNGFFSDRQQGTQQPFTTNFGPINQGSQTAALTGMFGNQGNYNSNALLPTNQTTGAYPSAQPTNGLGQGFGQGQQGFQNQQQGGQTFQQQNQPQGGQEGFNAGNAFTQMFNDPNVTMNYGQPQSLQSIVSQGGQPLQNTINDANGVPRQDGGYNQIPFNNQGQGGGQGRGGGQGGGNQGGGGRQGGGQGRGNRNRRGLGENFNTAVEQGYDPLLDQRNLTSAGTANLGLGFQNIQDSQNMQGQLIGQGQNLVNQGQEQYQQGAGAQSNLIGQNANQFNDYFQGLQPTLDQAGQYTSQAADMAKYSGQTINQAYGLAGQASSLAGQVPGDLDMARQFALQDRAQRGGLINQGTGTGLDQTSLNIADQIRQSSLQSAVSNITGGRVGDDLRNQVSAAQANAASRGLGIGSSPVINAQEGAQKERDRLLAEAQNQANAQYQQSLLALRGQQQANSMQGANLLNQSSMSSQGQLAGLIGAGASAIGAGSGALNAATGAQSAGGNILNEAARNQIAQAGQQTQAGQLLLAGQGQQQGANQALLNSGLQANQIGLGGLQGLAGAANQAGQLGVQQGQLGLNTQGQGYDQILAMLDAFTQLQNNQQRNKFLNAGTAVGAGPTA